MGLERRKESEARQALAFPLSGSRQHRCPAPARSPIPTHGSSRLSGSSAPGSPLPCAAGDRRELPSGAAAGTGRFRPSPLKGCGGLRTPDRPPGRAVPAEGQVPAEPDPRTEAGRAGPPPRVWTRRSGRAGPGLRLLWHPPRPGPAPCHRRRRAAPRPTQGPARLLRRRGPAVTIFLLSVPRPAWRDILPGPFVPRPGPAASRTAPSRAAGHDGTRSPRRAVGHATPATSNYEPQSATRPPYAHARCHGRRRGGRCYPSRRDGWAPTNPGVQGGSPDGRSRQARGWAEPSAAGGCAPRRQGAPPPAGPVSPPGSGPSAPGVAVSASAGSG